MIGITHNDASEGLAGGINDLHVNGMVPTAVVSDFAIPTVLLVSAHPLVVDNKINSRLGWGRLVNLRGRLWG
jgi:hypothetical protein